MKHFIDSYSADKAELEVLTSKPVSFLILGKRKSGKTTLARYLSHDWGAKLITEVDLIEGELSANSQLGTQIKETLENGGTIDKEIISKLYLKALTSEASDHYGVVV